MQQQLESVHAGRSRSAEPSPFFRLGGSRLMSESPSKTVVGRMSRYLRQVERAMDDGKLTISSRMLSHLMEVSDSQVRKDLGHLTVVGHAGIGFQCSELIDAIKVFLGLKAQWPIAVVGCGNLGQALMGYRGLRERGFPIAAGFDLLPDVINKTYAGIEVFNFAQFASVIAQKNLEIAALCVPPNVGQETADQMVAAGIRGILNFAPVILHVPQSVCVVNVDLTIEMEQLVFAVVQKRDCGL